MSDELKVGQRVHFKWDGRLKRDAKVLGVYGAMRGQPVKLDWNGIEYVCKRDEIITLEEAERSQKIEMDAKNRQEYGDIMDAWAKGLRTSHQIAAATNTCAQGIASRIRAAKRRGLLE